MFRQYSGFPFKGAFIIVSLFSNSLPLLPLSPECKIIRIVKTLFFFGPKVGVLFQNKVTDKIRLLLIAYIYN